MLDKGQQHELKQNKLRAESILKNFKLKKAQDSKLDPTEALERMAILGYTFDPSAKPKEQVTIAIEETEEPQQPT